MSQQSNPATLREALRKALCDDCRIGRPFTDDLKRAHVRLKPLRGKIRRPCRAWLADAALEAALAASGTEAAPTPGSYWKRVPGGFELTPTVAPSPEAAASPEGEGREQRNWKGVRWADSVKASTLAEEIALHFAHDCNDSMCGEDADASNCEVAWIEDKLTDFLDVQAALRQPAAPSGGLKAIIARLRDNANGMHSPGARAIFADIADELAALAQESKTSAVTETK